MGEPKSTKTRFQPGDIIRCQALNGPVAFLLIERKYDFVSQYMSSGKWWQWKVLDLVDGETDWLTENQFDFRYDVIARVTC